MFARNLDRILREHPYKYILTAFDSVARDVSTPVLLQVLSHFDGRGKTHEDIRVFFPKGNTAKAQSISWNLPNVDAEARNRVMAICRSTLEDKFADFPKLGKVYVDPSLKGYLVPFSQRSASKSLRTIVRGSQIPLGQDGNTARFFLWWKDKDYERVDIDLSASMFDGDWNYKTIVAYYNLRGSGYSAYHSGDITSAPNGACEFIDVDMPSVEKFGGRYIVMTVNSYTRQKFSELPECEAGWMVRQNPQSGEIFEPKTVVDIFTVSSESIMCAPLVIDVVERKIIWMDITVNANSIYGGNNVHSNRSSLSIVGKAMTSLHKPNLYELFTLHGKSRGKLVTSKDKADVVFEVVDGLPNVSMDEIVGKYL
jgi:stress response protein SCP2